MKQREKKLNEITLPSKRKKNTFLRKNVKFKIYKKNKKIKDLFYK